MRPIPSQHVWALLAQSERDAVTEMIVRALMEVVEHERLDQDPADPLTAPGRRIPAAVHSQASPPKL